MEAIWMLPDGRMVCRAITYMGWNHPPLQLPDNLDPSQPKGDGTGSDGQPADDSGVSSDSPSSNTSGTDNASLPSDDANSVVVEPVNQQQVGLDDPTVVDTQPVSDSSPVTGDNVTDPTSVDNCPPITDASDGSELGAVPVEPQSEDAADEATPVDA